MCEWTAAVQAAHFLAAFFFMAIRIAFMAAFFMATG
eukprot:CAMPEP_0183511862 /NCGR_PEP_ID=MMETSP0371-20130417/11185_1 /TAXON_ID=268820 /ORGANISM="Peridinium aciculiferum, Strain PAER-2" /LENGTH=35 /DNA_ID= /DNA_START= /DNA_END= /DNA_ORIENTATION=